MRPGNGTRFELVLESEHGTARAVYRATVFRPEGATEGRVEITPGGATLLEGAAGLEPALLTQLLAIARTLGKRADEGGWPRRILRWRQPGVR